MRTDVVTNDPGAAIWQRVFEFQGEISPIAARMLLKIQFPESDHARMDELSKRARAGTLTAKEQSELNTFEGLGCLLDIVHSNARQALKKKPKRAS
jgi:hypothetical protein